jgi:hypothetical protein
MDQDTVPHSGCYPDAIVIPTDLHQDGDPLTSMLKADGIDFKPVMTRSGDGKRNLYVYWWIPNMNQATGRKIGSNVC